MNKVGWASKAGRQFRGSGRLGFGPAISLPPPIEQCLCGFKSCINALFFKRREGSIVMEIGF